MTEKKIRRASVSDIYYLKTANCQTFFNLPYFPVNLQIAFFARMKFICVQVVFSKSEYINRKAFNIKKRFPANPKISFITNFNLFRQTVIYDKVPFLTNCKFTFKENYFPRNINFTRLKSIHIRNLCENGIDDNVFFC